MYSPDVTRCAPASGDTGVGLKTMRIILNPVVVDTQWGLQVLSKYFEDVDSLMQNAALIDDSMLAARLKVDTDMDEADRDLLVQTHNEYQRLFPYKLRYSFVLLLWTIVETQLKASCDFKAQHSDTSLTLADIRANDTLGRCRKYFEKVMDVKLDEDSLWSELNSLQKLRNCIAHANGVLEDIRHDGDRKHLEQYFRRGLGLSRDSTGAVAIEPVYCEHEKCGTLLISLT